MRKIALKLKAFFSSDSTWRWHVEIACGSLVLSLLVFFSYDQAESIYQECVAHEQEANGDATKCEPHLPEQSQEGPLDSPGFLFR